ncbi:MAG: hypothetical protein ACK4HE_02065 [Chitinophagaceae bacterium]
MARLFKHGINENNISVGYTELEKVLCKELDDTYIILTDVWLGIDYLNIVILHKESGIFIIKFHDFDITKIEVNPNGDWSINEEIIIASPIEQVLNYKENIIYFHIPELCEGINLDFRMGKFIKPWLILNSNTKEEIDNFRNTFLERKENFYKNECLNIWGYNQSQEIVREILKEKNKFKLPPQLHETILKSFSLNENEIKISENELFNIQQLKISKSKEGACYINGVVGSGKTSVIARRAINSFIRNHRQVLILTMNITLINLINKKYQT